MTAHSEGEIKPFVHAQMGGFRNGLTEQDDTLYEADDFDQVCNKNKNPRNYLSLFQCFVSAYHD